MSMHEALRSIPDRLKAWMGAEEAEEIKVEEPLTPEQDTAALLMLTRGAGKVDRTSGTWQAVAREAALDILTARALLETAKGEQVIQLQERIRTLRGVLETE